MYLTQITTDRTWSPEIGVEVEITEYSPQELHQLIFELMSQEKTVNLIITERPSETWKK